MGGMGPGTDPGPAPKRRPRNLQDGIAILSVALLLMTPSVSPERIVLGNFSDGDLSGWTPYVFHGRTSYFLVVDGERKVLMAQSRGAASGLHKEVTLDPWKYPVLRWSWKIEGTIPKGTALPNAFTSNAMMVAVESGDEKTGTWVAEERNVHEDYRTLFGEDPPAIGAVALMTDTDNTGGETTAYYGEITLQALPARSTIAPPTAAR